jgi:hypothetical protein
MTAHHKLSFFDAMVVIGIAVAALCFLVALAGLLL